MLDREAVRERLARLDWSAGFDRDRLFQELLANNLALPNEFLSAIEPIEVYYSPAELVASVPDVVWTIHAERERRARGQIQKTAAERRTSRAQVA